jgi:N,N'-diacetylchitobiose phosphorylase
MRYGHFDDEKNEYVIERPDTPASWVNYLGTDEYCAIVSNNASGYGFHKSPKSGRLLRFRFNSVPTDRPGRYFYIKDAEDGDTWSVTWQPVAKPFKKPGEPQQPGEADYQCAHSPGTTRFTCKYKGIEAELRAFVPPGENAEVWSLVLKNGDTPRTLDLFGYVEWCFWHIQQDAMNFQYILYTCRMGQEDGIIDYSLRLWPMEEPKAYFASTEKVDSFDTDREVFLGNYRHEGEPVAVENSKCSNSIAIGGTPCGALHHRVELAAGEVKEITFIAGVGDAKTEGKRLRKHFAQEGAVDAALAEVASYWDERLGAFSMDTPDAALNSMGNVWNQVQCHTTFNWSRSASFNEAGGRDGLGFRDSCQDVLGVLHAIPAQVKTRLVELLRAQHSFGAAMHHVQPLSWTQGEHNVTPPHFSDDHLWLLLAIPAYIRETGDTAFLSEKIQFADKGEGTVYQHLKAAVDFSWGERGPHGLCKGLAADWNDCLNLKGEGETIFSTFLFLRAIRELLLVIERFSEGNTQMQADAAEVAGYRDGVLAAIEEHGWDGDWFLRGFVDSGKKIGSKESQGSTIFLNAQSWAVLSDAAPREKLQQAMDSVHEHLASEHGAVLNAPSYTEHDAEVGAITTFPGGLKENGGIFCHANTWPVVAEAMLGRGDRAYELYRAFLPAAKNEEADLYSMEPYAYAQFITGKDHPYKFGRARNSWLTGTATWAFVAMSQYILGIRADYDGLVIDPAIPSDWAGYRATRRFRGADYRISVEGSGTLSEVTVDGVPLDLPANEPLCLPVAKEGSLVEVRLLCGMASDQVAQ